MNRWVFWINRAFLAFISIFLLSSAALWFQRPDEISAGDQLAKKHTIPKGAFTLSKESYLAIGEPAFSLKFSGASLQLPDLRTHLVFCGKNGRPDSTGEQSSLTFVIGNSKMVASMVPGEKVYLIYDGRQNPCKYNFSPNNTETSLWFEVDSLAADTVNLKMKNENGQIVEDPDTHAHFKPQEKDYTRIAGYSWELGGQRVDGALLARQKARWYGPDRFLEKMGGEEFEFVKGKQRIDFGDGEDLYSVFVEIEEILAWDKGRWNTVKAGEASRGKPLMVIKRIEDRLLAVELWDVEGRGKIPLNLIKTSESWTPDNIENDFKFLGARTRSQCIFEVQNERMLLRPHDWLLLKEGEWIKLNTPEEIDNFVQRKLSGTLFVFDGVVRKEDRQVLVGSLFNPSRTEVAPIELALQQTSIKVLSSPDSDDDDDDDEGDKKNLPVAKWSIDKTGRYVE